MRSLLRAIRLSVLLLAVVGLGLPLTESAHAQKKQAPGAAPAPRLLVLTPAAGQVGTSVEVVLTGQDLDEPKSLLCSLPGVEAEYLGAAEPLKTDPAANKKNKGMAKAGPVTAARFRISIPEKAAVGIHDLRFVGKHGVSNPRAFAITDQPVVLEKEPNNDVADAQKIEIDTVVHGSISAPTDVDYFLFPGKKGQRVVVSVRSSSIDSRLPAAVQLYRSGGTLLATGRDYADSDAVADAVLPADDDYYVRVFAFTYTQGSAEHFYLLNVTTAPWIDAVFPPVVAPGQASEVTVFGRNLPGGKLDPESLLDGKPLEKVQAKITPPKTKGAAQRLAFNGYVPPRSAAIDGFGYRMKNKTGASNPVLIGYARAPVVLDNGENDTAETAQEVEAPCEIAGRIEKKRDRDWYKFAVKKGETYTLDLFGDRLGAPVDLYFTIQRANAKSGSNDEIDDNPEILQPQLFFNRTDDPARYRLNATEDGAYLVQVTSREADVLAGPRSQYVLRITPEQADFKLIAMPTPQAGAQNQVTAVPAGVTVPRRGAEAFTILAWREGYNGEIQLSAEGLPAGVSCPPQVIAAGQKQALLVVTAAEDAEPWSGFFTIKGVATIDEKEVTREARPATIVWPAAQGGAAGIARLDRELALAVSDRVVPFRVGPAVEAVKMPPSTKAPLALKVDRLGDFKGPVQITLLNYAQNQITFNNNQPLTISGGDANAVLDVKNIPEGAYNLVFRATAAIPIKDDQGKETGTINVQQTSLPIALVVAKSAKAAPLAKLDIGEITVTPNPLKLSAGMMAEVEVRVKRKKGDTTPLTVQLVPPSGNDFFRPQEATIEGGSDRTKLPVRASGRTKAGDYKGLIVRVSAGGGAKDAVLSVSVK